MKKAPKHYSQKMYLFVIYGLFILVLLFIFFIFTYSHYRNNARKEAAKALETMCSSMVSSVNTQLDDLSTISMNIVYSNAIKENFKEFSRTYGRSGIPGDQAASRENALAIYDIVTALIGAYQTAPEINLYTMDGSRVQAGYWQTTSTLKLEDLPWYEETVRLHGYKYITNPTRRDDLPAKGANQQSRCFLSLVRLFLDYSGQPEGIVEVVQDCDKLFSLASQLEAQNPGVGVTVYNSRNEAVYPYVPGSIRTDFYPLIAGNSLEEGVSRFIRDDSGRNLLFTYAAIPDYDWTVVLTQPRSAVYESLRTFQVIFAAIGIFSILLMLMICFYISERLTAPLAKLTAAAGKITINRVLDEKKVNLTSADSNILEVARLCESIRDMYEKLRSTSKEVLLSQSEETRAKLQATQSLINPHFLYNCLTNISIMAEEGMNEDIVKMCQALCDYFRYISSSKYMIVPLEEEFFYTRRYLECMQFRFPDELEFSLTMEEETKQYYIPRLILQPIVENAFKYAFEIPPPWRLTLSSHRKGDSLLVRVEDNGGCLSEGKKQELLTLCQNLDMREELKSMQIGGMGLKNVYLRLKLLYGDRAIFEIDNSMSGRTVFILGGPIYHSREEYYEEHPQL